MEQGLNPYTPGSGRRPPALTGRDRQIAAFDLIVARSKLGRTDRGIVFTGLRGVGKTSLLNYLRVQIADRHEWVTIALEGQTSPTGAAAVRRQLGRELLVAVRRFSHRRKIEHVLDRLQQVIGSFTVSVGPVEISREAPEIRTLPGRAGSGYLEIDLSELVEDVTEVLRDQRSALAIFVDELQDLDPDLMSALITVQHMANQRELPFFLIGAGLPNLPAILSTARSYAERLFDYTTIGPLPAVDAARALTEPAERFGAGYEPDALTHLVDASGGYPYFLQTFGQAIWNLAPDNQFTRRDAEAAVAEGWQRLDMGFFPSRWKRATAAEREYLHTMATLGGSTPSTGDIAHSLHSTQKALSVPRGRLIDKGLIYSPEHGHVAFTVPGMSEFLQRQDPSAS